MNMTHKKIAQILKNWNLESETIQDIYYDGTGNKNENACYAATAVLSETFGEDNDRWLEVCRDIINGYDAVVKLSDEERRAIPYVILANQFVCVAWFAQQEKYAEIFEINKKMTAWLIDRFEDLGEMV